MRDKLEHIVLCMFNSIDASDWTALDAYFHPHIEYRRPGYEAIQGLEQLHVFYERTRIVKSGRHTINTLLCDPEAPSVCVTGAFSGVDKSGRDLDVRFCDVYLFQDEKIIRRETFFSVPAV
ncbi:nuclear transport factor 2 family protein [Herbaspirillum sp. GCM10030257]|uniref:nuclear transport factor 2 family protein n=1 Tax=Herbaspirillum sp. GCM10030257 TaxID=3273393 RepID=UPI00360B6DAF